MDQCNICENTGILVFPDGSEMVCSCTFGDVQLQQIANPAPNFVYGPGFLESYTAGRLLPENAYNFSTISADNALALALYRGASLELASNFEITVKGLLRAE